MFVLDLPFPKSMSPVCKLLSYVSYLELFVEGLGRGEVLEEPKIQSPNVPINANTAIEIPQPIIVPKKFFIPDGISKS
jgi:hypothetical protein